MIDREAEVEVRAAVEWLESVRDEDPIAIRRRFAQTLLDSVRSSPAQDDEEMVPLRIARKAVKAAQNEAKAQRAAAQEGLTTEEAKALAKYIDGLLSASPHGMVVTASEFELVELGRAKLRRLAGTDQGEPDG